jgi:hypothetical protein
MRWWLRAASAGMGEGYKEAIGLPEFRISATAPFRHLDETQSLRFPNGGGHEARRDAIVDEILLGYGQSAIIVAAMMRKLDFQPIDNPARRER